MARTSGAGASGAGSAEHEVDTTDAHDASAISVAPAGGITETEVQAALGGLDTRKIDKATLNANTILFATVDDTPAALAVAASRIVGRKATGDISAMTAAELVAIIRTTLPVEWVVAASDETTTLTTGVAKVTFRLPFAMTVSGVRASVNTASTSGLVTVDINEAGVSILSTKLTIDATEKTSQTAATAAVISDASLADDAEITIDIDTAGTGAKGLKVALIGTRTS